MDVRNAVKTIHYEEMLGIRYSNCSLYKVFFNQGLGVLKANTKYMQIITFLLSKIKTSSLRHFEAYEYLVKIYEGQLSIKNQTMLLKGVKITP